MRILLIAFVLLLDAAPAARAVETAALERGTAITDPATLRELDGGRFRLDRMLLPERSADAPLSNSELFALPSMTPVRQAIDGEFERYVIRHKASLPNETVGVGEAFDFQLFDQALLTEGGHLEDPNRFAKRVTELLTQVASVEARA